MADWSPNSAVESNIMKLGSWNVQTLMDSDTHPERMMVIVGHELAKYDVAIADLSETRRADTRSLKEVGASYTFYWCGKLENEQRIHGVGFAIRNDIASGLSSVPKGFSEQIMTLHLSLSGESHLTLIISVYAPTMMHPAEDKELFYTALRDVIHSVPVKDKLSDTRRLQRSGREQPACMAWGHWHSWPRHGLTRMAYCFSVYVLKRTW